MACYLATVSQQVICVLRSLFDARESAEIQRLESFAHADRRSHDHSCYSCYSLSWEAMQAPQQCLGTPSAKRCKASLQPRPRQQQQPRFVVAQASRRDVVSTGLTMLTSGALMAQPAAAAPPAAAPAPPKPFCAVVDNVPGWAYSTPWQEDLVSFAGGKTWYRWVNYVPPASGGLGGVLTSWQRRYSPAAPDKVPLLVLSGGPGLPCSYLEPFELMAGVGRQVIFYDQVGCGNTFLASNSSCPPVSQLTPELYLQQIDALRAALQLERCHLYGQGIGGMLALSYAAQNGGKQAGVLSVTVGSVAPSYQQLVSDRQAAAKQLLGPEQAELLLQANSSSSNSSSSDAAAAWQQYERQHICRLPAATVSGGCVSRALQQRSQPVFEALSGGQYFAAAGGLADWSVSNLNTAALQDVPVLLTRGEFDEVSQGSALQVATALTSSGGQVATFRNSGSYMHIDAWEPHLTRVEEHMCAAEGSTPPTAAAS